MKFIKETEFVTKNSYEIESRPLSELVDTTHFKNGENLHLISYKNETNVSGFINKNNIQKVERVISKDSLEKICANPADFSNIVKNDDSYIYYMGKDYLSYVAIYGENENFTRLMGVEYRPMDSFIKKECFSNQNNDLYEFIQFVPNENHMRVWCNSNGELTTQPIIFDYIGANLDNENYYLDELVEYLMTRDDVAFITDTNSWSSNRSNFLKCPLKGDEKGIEGIISDIPGYNAEEGRDETITLVYYPKAEDISKIMNWKRDENDKTARIWNQENYIVRDILGCDKFSKKPVIVEEPAVPKRKFKR